MPTPEEADETQGAEQEDGVPVIVARDLSMAVVEQGAGLPPLLAVVYRDEMTGDASEEDKNGGWLIVGRIGIDRITWSDVPVRFAPKAFSPRVLAAGPFSPGEVVITWLNAKENANAIATT